MILIFKFNNMSITVKSLDEFEAKEVLKTCPKIIQQYVKSLINSVECRGAIMQKAVSKLKAFEDIKHIEEYAYFCVECDRNGLPLLKYNDWINQYKLKEIK
jgi:hypothetical protein